MTSFIFDFRFSILLRAEGGVVTSAITDAYIAAGGRELRLTDTELLIGSF
jgi:hypothetical protein